MSQPPAATDCGVAVHVLLSAIHSTPRGRGRAPRALVLHAHSPQRSNRSVTGADKRGAGERGHSCYHGRVPHGGADWGGFVWEGVQGAPALHFTGHSSLLKMMQNHACRFECAGGERGRVPGLRSAGNAHAHPAKGFARALEVVLARPITRVPTGTGQKAKLQAPPALGKRWVLRQQGAGAIFFTLVTSPGRSLSLKLGDTRVYEPQLLGAMRAGGGIEVHPQERED